MLMRWLPWLLASLIFVALAALSWALGQWFSADAVQKIDNAGILLGWVLACASGPLAFLAWIRRQDIRRWLRRRRFESVGEEFRVDKEKVTALVIPVSRPEQPRWLVRWLEPSFVSLLYTEASRTVAAQLADEFAGRGIHLFPERGSIASGQMEVSDPNEINQSRQVVLSFLNYYSFKGIPPGEIFVDTTGGKKPMSIGAFQAAEEAGVSSIYVVGRGTRDEIVDPEQRSHGFPVFISNHTE